MNDAALEPVAILRVLGEELPPMDTLDEALQRSAQLERWAQTLLPKAREVLAGLPQECGESQREAVIHCIGWALRILDCTHPSTLHDATWHVENLTTCCRLLANIVVTLGECRLPCAWCGDDPLPFQATEAGHGSGRSLSGCIACRTRP